jgi:hypothetical protein
MDLVLTLVLSCSVHLDDNLVAALAYRFSKGKQFFVGDLSTLDTYESAKDVGEARQLVVSIQAAGGRPAVGYMAVPVSWAARFGRSPDDLFDGCTNIGVATAMLSEYDRLCTAGPSGRRAPAAGSRRRHPTPPPSARRACVLQQLELDMNLKGIVAHVLPVAARLDRAPADPDDDASGARSPIFPGDGAAAPGDREWNSRDLFFPTASPMPRATSAASAKVVPPATSRDLSPAERETRSADAPAVPQSRPPTRPGQR